MFLKNIISKCWSVKSKYLFLVAISSFKYFGRHLNIFNQQYEPILFEYDLQLEFWLCILATPRLSSSHVLQGPEGKTQCSPNKDHFAVCYYFHSGLDS